MPLTSPSHGFLVHFHCLWNGVPFDPTFQCNLSSQSSFLTTLQHEKDLCEQFTCKWSGITVNDYNYSLFWKLIDLFSSHFRKGPRQPPFRSHSTFSEVFIIFLHPLFALPPYSRLLSVFILSHLSKKNSLLSLQNLRHEHENHTQQCLTEWFVFSQKMEWERERLNKKARWRGRRRSKCG